VRQKRLGERGVCLCFVKPAHRHTRRQREYTSTSQREPTRNDNIPTTHPYRSTPILDERISTEFEEISISSFVGQGAGTPPALESGLQADDRMSLDLNYHILNDSSVSKPTQALRLLLTTPCKTCMQKNFFSKNHISVIFEDKWVMSLTFL